METLRVDIQNEQEKRVLLAFLDSLDYNYRIDNESDAVLEQQAKELASRKADFLAGKASSLPWSESK
ncbi:MULTISPECIES: addiction module protein [Mucilaginibacter]|uniref:Putative addiction module component n=1 Tax=Mucilaginibacter gossypiicola TaxID=551995 RepID=A0A1H8H8I4_9SPHI|nr:addiction module protein [Mucilaginibacter gossypiicola]SEN52631.1 Putative addiction module component [Mucilaginibacter gossypiicola]